MQAGQLGKNGDFDWLIGWQREFAGKMKNMQIVLMAGEERE